MFRKLSNISVQYCLACTGLAVAMAMALVVFVGESASAKNTNPNTPRPIIDMVEIDPVNDQLVITGVNLFEVDSTGLPLEVPTVTVGDTTIDPADTIPDETSNGTVVRVNFVPGVNTATTFVVVFENDAGTHTVDVTAGAVAAAQAENDTLQADLESQIDAEAAARTTADIATAAGAQTANDTLEGVLTTAITTGDAATATDAQTANDALGTALNDAIMAGDDAVLAVSANTTDQNTLFIGSDQDQNESGSQLQLGTDGNPILNINEAGNVGIGLPSGQARFHVRDSGFSFGISTTKSGDNRVGVTSSVSGAGSFGVRGTTSSIIEGVGVRGESTGASGLTETEESVASFAQGGGITDIFDVIR